MPAHRFSQEALTSPLDRAVEAVRLTGARALIVGPSVDLRYLVGVDLRSSDRPILLTVLPSEAPVLRIAQIEADAVASMQGVVLSPYAEGEDPISLIAKDVQRMPGDGQIAIGDSMWAAWLLRFQLALPASDFFAASRLLGPLRIRKSPREKRLLDRAAKLADAAFDQLRLGRFEGRTEKNVACDLSNLLLEQGLDRATWGPIVASGPNSASPHHQPGDRVIERGDAVVLDFGGILEGYQADITRTVHVGPAADRFQHVYDAVRSAQDAGVRAVRPGVPAQSVDAAARGVIEEAGLGEFFIHRTGHGVGLECHEEPYIIQGNEQPLEEGMAFSVEPGVYIPGEFGVRIEDIVTVTQTGGQRLNEATRDLVCVD